MKRFSTTIMLIAGVLCMALCSSCGKEEYKGEELVGTWGCTYSNKKDIIISTGKLYEELKGKEVGTVITFDKDGSISFTNNSYFNTGEGWTVIGDTLYTRYNNNDNKQWRILKLSNKNLNIKTRWRN